MADDVVVATAAQDRCAHEIRMESFSTGPRDYVGLFAKSLFFAARAGVVKPRQPLCHLNPFDSIFLILRRVGVGARVVSTLLPEFPPRVKASATYLASALRDLCGKPIPAPLRCHSVGRGTSVPTGNTDACGRAASLVRLSGHCCIGANRHGHTLGKCGAASSAYTDSGPDVAHVQ